MNTFRRATLARALGLGAALGFSAVLAATPTTSFAADEINFGLISTESSQNLRADWQPLIDDLQKQTGLKVKAFFAPDYAGIIEGMRFRKVQMAWLGNKSAMEAVDRSEGEIFAQMQFTDGSLGYKSHLIVHKDSPIDTIDQVFEKASTLSFGNGDPNSTSGFLVPGYYVFGKNHKDPKQIFKVVRNANHGTNAMAVANRQIDVATNNSENLDKMKERSPEQFKELKIIWTSPLIPSDPLVMRKDLPQDTKDKLKKFFANYGKSDPREQEVLRKVNNLKGFVASSNDQLKPIRQLELFAKRNRIDADPNLSQGDKQARTAEIDRELSKLN